LRKLVLEFQLKLKLGVSNAQFAYVWCIHTTLRPLYSSSIQSLQTLSTWYLQTEKIQKSLSICFWVDLEEEKRERHIHNKIAFILFEKEREREKKKEKESKWLKCLPVILVVRGELTIEQRKMK
jgi:hypothetical protein